MVAQSQFKICGEHSEQEEDWLSGYHEGHILDADDGIRDHTWPPSAAVVAVVRGYPGSLQSKVCVCTGRFCDYIGILTFIAAALSIRSLTEIYKVEITTRATAITYSTSATPSKSFIVGL